MPYVTFVPQAPMGESADPGIFVQGTHVPAPLVERSGVWIKTAGSAILLQQNYRLSTCDAPLWLVVDDGGLMFEHREMKVPLKKGECVVIPPHTEGCMISQAKDSRLLWLTVEGALTEDFMRQMNALNRVPAKQGMLPSMVVLIRQIVQVLVRHTGTGEASYQLGQLLWGLIAAHSGQSVATSATLSHEIARVVDALRACRYRDAFSLADMAAISRMPVETFRKRFTGHPSAGISAVSQDGARQDAAARRHECAADGRGDRHARSLSFQQAVQAHRGHEPHSLPQARRYRGAPPSDGKFRNVIPYSIF